MRWHTRYHQDALDGMLMLTLEERGAYNTILDLIYAREAPIPDDARWLAGWMGCSLRRWSTIRTSLIFKGKIQEINLNSIPSLMNERAASEIEKSAKLSRNLSESGSKGGRKRAENALANNENKDLDQANAQAPLKLYTETLQGQNKKDTSEAKASSVQKEIPDKRGTRLPEDWTPSPTDVAAARKRGLTDPEIDLEADRFRNHWLASSGANSRKRSWPRAWDNWCISAAERRKTGPRLASATGQPGGNGRGHTTFADVIAKRRGYVS